VQGQITNTALTRPHHLQNVHLYRHLHHLHPSYKDSSHTRHKHASNLSNAQVHHSNKVILQFIKLCCVRQEYIPETLYSAIWLLDSYLQRINVQQWKQLHLLGVTCVYIAAKVSEELNEPRGKDLIAYSPVQYPLTFDEMKVHEA
jgi:Cyclin, N-terminal domain